MKLFEGLFNPRECLSIIEHGTSLGLKPATVNKKEKGDYDSPLKRSTLCTFIYPTDQSLWMFKRFNDVSDAAMIFERLQFLKYQAQDHFEWHQDWGVGNPRVNSRRFSWSVLLNNPDEYQGCNLWIQEQENIKQAPRIQGMGVRFLSKDIHKVTHCISGTRYALTAFQLDPSNEVFIFNKKEMYFNNAIA